jgi:hypothetical protein
MADSSNQARVFNRTGRLAIDSSDLDFEFDHSTGRLLFRGFHDVDEWSSSAATGSVVVVTVFSSASFKVLRIKRSCSDVLVDGWEGESIQIPRELMLEGIAVKMNVTLRAPDSRLVARGTPITLKKGGEFDRKARGGSLLPVRPTEEIKGLCQVRIEDGVGPVLLVNNRLGPGLNWADVKRNPHFKYGVFSTALYPILMHLAHDVGGCQEGWGQPWVDHAGVSLVRLEDFREEDPSGGVLKWVEETIEDICAQASLVDKFIAAQASHDGGADE